MKKQYRTLLEIIKQFNKEKAEISWMIEYGNEAGEHDGTFKITVHGKENGV